MNIIGISGLHNSMAFRKEKFPNLERRQYRLAPGHDSAAALINNAGIQAVAAEERFTRVKGTGAFPINAIQYCLQSGRIAPEAIDYIAHGFSFEPFRSFYEQYDDVTKEEFARVYARDTQIQYLQEHFPGQDWTHRFIQVPHHIAHAASTFYVSGFKDALILITDGMGELHSATIAIGKDDQIEVIKQIPALHSLGILYGIVTLYLGFDFGFDEYKVMGLAPYGNPRRFFSTFMEFIELKEDGTYVIPILFQNETLHEKITYSGTLQILADTFGPQRQPEDEMTQHHMDVAAGLQAALQAALMHVLRHFKKETGQNNLCMAGGVALNCTANGAINQSRLFKNMFVQPAAADDGTALGAALYAQKLHQPTRSAAKMVLPLWGPSFDNETIQQLLASRQNCTSRYYESFTELADEVARRIAEGQVIAWFQGRMEFGPRALGNRSILADPRDPNMRDYLNQLVKKREGFRPFAPAVTAEGAAQFFEIDPAQRSLYIYMLLTTQTRAAYREKLPAVTHVNGSARVQVVFEEQSPRFWTLLNAFGKITGIPIILNTSFNVRGQPIVCTPTEALDTFLSTNIDALVMENHLVTHQEQE